MLDVRQLERGIWSIADGRGSDDDLALLLADERASLAVLDRLILETEDDLASVRNLPGEERDQVVADLSETLESLLATAARFRPRPTTSRSTRSDRDEFRDEFVATDVEGSPTLDASGRPTRKVQHSGSILEFRYTGPRKTR